MERTPFDHLGSNLTMSCYRKIFSANNIYKLSYYHYTPSRHSKSADRRYADCTFSGVLHLWEQTPQASLCIVSRLLATVKVDV